MAKAGSLAGCVLPLGMNLDNAPNTADPLRGAPRKAQENAFRPFAIEHEENRGPRPVDGPDDTDGPSRHDAPEHEPALDHWIECDGESFAGRHLIVDLWGAERLDDIDHVRQAMMDSVEASGATLLHIHLHHFTPNGGISGVAVLAESHISIHSWPERSYAALDIFMCGDAIPEKAIPVLREAFRPDRVHVEALHRGAADEGDEANQGDRADQAGSAKP